MKTKKMSFKDIKDVLSRDEMKSIMAGSNLRICFNCVQTAANISCNSFYNSGQWFNYSTCVNNLSSACYANFSSVSYGCH